MEKLILSEIYQLPEHLKIEVLHFIAFLKQSQLPVTTASTRKERVFGGSKNHYVLAPDFDAPIDDFNEYM